ncbi:MAG: GDP-mannose 4,6-dehydratase [Chloroflexi bacterium]|nr:GDP-mannose 4,6-dehydratase [Chloroflexota bacterium]
MNVLITGVTGMAGSHLAEYLLTLNGLWVFGTYRRRSLMDNLADLTTGGRVRFVTEGGSMAAHGRLERAVAERAMPGRLNLIEADLADPYSVQRLIAAVRPDRIFHLAAQSYVPASWDAPEETLSLNVLGELHLLEAVRQAGINPLIHIAGSSEEYGLVFPHETPIRETNPLRPLSPYAVSKVAQELLALQYFHSYGLRTVVTRGFNHTGPRRGVVFVTSSFAQQIAEIEKGRRAPVLLTGDLTSRRDWSDVRDVVQGYWLALEKGEPGQVYNIGSGYHYSVGEMLETLLGMTGHRIEVELDPALLRPSDVKLLWSDCSRFQDRTGWAPRIKFKQTLSDLLDYWRQRV